jgi:hypothetical protein
LRSPTITFPRHAHHSSIIAGEQQEKPVAGASSVYGRAAMMCGRCEGTEFRLSGMKWRDVPRLLTLRYPMRCRACHHRMYGGRELALMLKQLRRCHPGAKES